MKRKPGPIRIMYDKIMEMSQQSGVLTPEQVADFMDALATIQNPPSSTDDGPLGSKTVQ